MKENIDIVRNRMLEAQKRAGRENENIILIAVSKTQTIDKLIEAKNEGLTIFGENKVQELVEKFPQISGVDWHLIGSLQKNKVKYIIDKVKMIHSLDSLELAAEINKRAIAIGIKMPVLLQVNIGKETSKSGVYEEAVSDILMELSGYSNLTINGFMTVPPISGEDSTRAYFRRMKNLFDNAKKLKYDNFDIKFLSMGMTEDFEIAIEEGANIIRVGTGIFGKRVYKEE